jgi:hypothetical protein
MGLRGSLPLRQLTSPRPVQGLRRDGDPGAEHAEATARKSVQRMKDLAPGTTPTAASSATRHAGPVAGC